MTEIVRILRKSIQNGIAGTQYDDRVLGHQSGRFQELMQRGGLLDGGALNRIVLYVTAIMEVKSSMGVIVAAPRPARVPHCPAMLSAWPKRCSVTKRDGQGDARRWLDRRLHCDALDVCS